MLGETSDEANRKKPFVFLSSIFKRRREHDVIDADSKPPEVHFEESNFYDDSWMRDEETIHSPPRSTPSPIKSSFLIASAAVGISVSEASVTSMGNSPPSFAVSYVSSGLASCTSPGLITSSCTSPILIHHTPIKSRDIGEDMEAIRLSRQDNPYLQKVDGSQTSSDEDNILERGPVIEEKDTTQLVAQSGAWQEPVLSITEVHEHLIRSPPPTTVSKTLTGKGIFIFPVESEDSFPNRPIASKTQSLNPLVSRGHENVLDHSLKQILDIQRKLSFKGDKSFLSFSASVPGSPARQSVPVQSKSHARTHSEDSATILSSNEGNLAPVIGSTLCRRSPSEVVITRPLHPVVTKFSTPSMPPLYRNSKVNDGCTSNVTLMGAPMITSGGSSSSILTLPIRCPHQPASSKVT